MPKFDFTNRTRAKLRGGETTFGIWVTLADATVTELCAEAGVDWVCVDLEHGALDYKDVLNHLRAAKGSDLSVFVRPPNTTVDSVKRILDLGADGLLLPLISSRAELEEAFSFGRYPTVGKRGIGCERAAHWGLALEDYVAAANSETMVIPLIETAAASDNIDEILSVPGLEAIFFGPADLSQSRGHMAVWEGPGVAEDIRRMARLAQGKGIATGVIGRGLADIRQRQEQGFKMIGMGSDVGAILKVLRDGVKELKGIDISTKWF